VDVNGLLDPVPDPTVYQIFKGISEKSSTFYNI
jgi:hypothetical protein